MREGDIYIVLGCFLKSCEESRWEQETSRGVRRRVGRILPEENVLVCDDEMMMFEGGDRLEKSEGMELT